MQNEQKAYYAPNKVNIEKTKTKFNQSMAFEMKMKMIRYKNENNLEFFNKILTHAEVLCEKVEEGEYRIKKVFS